VSDAADPTTAKIAASEKTRRRNAPYAVEITPRITKAANITTTSYRTPPTRSSPIPTAVPDHTTTPNNLPNQQRSYVDVVGNRVQQDENSASTLKTFLEDFKRLFAQLLQQNSLILNMLTTLINKPH